MTTGKTIALTRRICVGKVMSLLFNMLTRLVGHNFPSKRQVSFNFMAAITICSDFGAPQNSLSLFPLLPLKGPTFSSSFPGGSDSKESACNAGDSGSIPGSGRSPGEGNGNPLQCPCLENSMDRGAWRATVHGVAKSWTRQSDFHLQAVLLAKTRNARQRGPGLQRESWSSPWWLQRVNAVSRLLVRK